MKKFYEKWDSEEIDDHLRVCPILILFKIHVNLGEAEIVVHGNLSQKQEILLKVCIVGEFGGDKMSEKLCITINEYAEKWYNRFVKPQKIRVLNFAKKGS